MELQPKVAKYAWKYGVKAVDAVVARIKNSWNAVKKWIEAGMGVQAIVEAILNILGLG